MAVVVVYGGGFQPFHAGHLSSYVEAKRAFPDAEFFVAASNDVKQRPIPFKVKKFLAQQAGVRDAFVEVRQPLNPKEILELFDPAKDIFVLVRSERDPMPYTKKDGSPAYFQPFVSLDQCNPYGKNAYVLVTKKKDFTVNGQEVYSGSQVRDMYTNADDANKEQIISQLYPKSSHKDTIKQVLDQYLQSAPKTVLEPKVPAAKQLKNKKLAEMIRQARPLLKEASLEKKVKFLKLLKEYAIRSNEPGDDDDDDAEILFKFAKMWYNGNEATQQSVEQTLASVKPIGYEIGEIESEEGGAFVVQSGDENGRTYIGWSKAQLTGLEEGFYDQTIKTRNKIAQQANPTRNKFIWKRPNQIRGSYTDQELTSQGFRKSAQNNLWGGTQEMWNRLSESLNEFAPPSRDDGGGENDRNRRIRKLLEIAIQVAKEKNVDELGMIHAMNMIAGDEFFNTAVEGILPDITDKEYMFVLQSAYKTVKQGLAEGKKKRKKKSKNRSIGRYFFPGYNYYGGSGESGESGGDGGGEGVAEGSLNELAPGGNGGDGGDDRYIPPNFGKPYAARYLGKNEFEVFCRPDNDPSKVIKLRAIVQKYGLEFDDDDYDEETGEGGRWYLDSPGAVWLGWQYGEIPLPRAIDQVRNPGHIHDLVTNYLTNAHDSEIQQIATEYFGFTMDGDMNESMDYLDEK
jgi:hypothetical protein